ncbi:MAG: hypothetical protein ACTSO7_08880 [Candidatus Heimdallarchaeota archaeon]
MTSKKRIKEIFEIMFEAITNEPQSVGKIAKKTGLHWRTVNEYVEMIEKLQAKKKVRVTKNPTQIWYVEE